LLHRNFQGYTSHGDCDLVGLGVTAISMVDDCYSQNLKLLANYENTVESGHLPLSRGLRLDADDKIRRDAIMQLICDRCLDMDIFSQQHHIVFSDYFADELQSLQVLVADGLVVVGDRYIDVLPAGALLLRNICMIFDRFLPGRENQHFSRAI